MYEVLVKHHNRTQYIKHGKLTDHKNAYENAVDIVISLINYFNGYDEEHNYFVSNHPQSTINTPKYYCIPDIDVFRVYKHTKEKGWIFSDHLYEKKFTIKIIKSKDRIFIFDDYNSINRIDTDQKNKMDNLMNSLKKTMKKISEKKIDFNPSSISDNFESTNSCVVNDDKQPVESVNNAVVSHHHISRLI